MNKTYKLSDSYLKKHKIPKLDGELWKYVILDRHPEYNAVKKYLVSTKGRVLNRITHTLVKPFDSNRSNADGEHWQRVLLYYSSIQPKGIKYSLHKLVALAFIPNDDIENKIQVNHIDGHPTNNDVSNLEWVTISENMLHAHSMGLVKGMKIGEERSNAVFTNEDIHVVCQLMELGHKAMHIYTILIDISPNPNITYERVKALVKHIRYQTHWTHISKLYKIKFNNKKAQRLGKTRKCE